MKNQNVDVIPKKIPNINIPKPIIIAVKPVLPRGSLFLAIAEAPKIIEVNENNKEATHRSSPSNGIWEILV